MTSIPASSFREAKGSVQLNHQSQAVHVIYHTFPSQESITVGSDTFKLSSEGSNGFEGRRLVKENGKATEDRNISINTDAASVASFKDQAPAIAEQLSLQNKDEFRYTQGDNALIILSDNLNGTIVANFAHLDPSAPPAPAPLHSSESAPVLVGSAGPLILDGDTTTVTIPLHP